MQLSRFLSVLLVASAAGLASAQTVQSSSAASGSTSSTSASSLASKLESLSPEEITGLFSRAGVDLSKRSASPLLSPRMQKVQESNKKRQDNINVSGDCSQGKAQCCDTTLSKDQQQNVASLVGLDDLAGQIGINCVNLPVNVIGVSGSVSNICKSTPVCCQNVTQNGLVNLGCSALPIN